MNPTIKALRQERVDCIKKARDIFNKDGGPSVADHEEIERLHAAAKTAGDKADVLEAGLQKQQALEASLERSAGRQISLTQDAGDERPAKRQAIELSYGNTKLTIDPRNSSYERCTAEYQDACRQYLRGNMAPMAVLQTDVPTSGGYLTVAEQFNAELIQDLDEVMWIRRLARKFVTDAQSLGTPYKSARAASAAWGAELTSPTADTAFAVGKRRISPHYMTGLIDVSRDLMRSAVMPVESIVNHEIMLDTSYLEETAFMTGNGVGRPLGIFTASDDGIPTSRDVAATSTTALDADVFLTAKYTLKQQYRGKATGFVMHKDSILAVSKFKTGTGEYLWKENMRIGEPDTIAGFSVYESEYAPNTFTTGQYLAVLGDFSRYWIVDSLGLEMQRLVETKAIENKDQFLYRRKVDAAPVHSNAFVRIKLA